MAFVEISFGALDRGKFLVTQGYSPETGCHFPTPDLPAKPAQLRHTHTNHKPFPRLR